MRALLSAVITLWLAQSPDRPGTPQFRTLRYTIETIAGSETSADTTRTSTISLAYPDKARVETELANRRIILVSDGKWTWAYDPQKNIFAKTAGVFGASDDASVLDLLPTGTSDILALASPPPPGTSKPVGEDTIEVGAKQRRCSVTEVSLSKRFKTG